MADGWASLGDSLSRVRARAQRVDRGCWSGPDARRCWDELDRIASELGSLAVTIDLAARRLLAQAMQQRRASEADVAVRTLEHSHGGDGRWVGWVGPEDATVVVVLVPGVGTDEGDRASLELDAGRVREHLQLVGERRLSGESVAVVAWLGYDPPDNILSGVRRGPAAEGAARLALDVDRWRVAGARRVVAVGHSYGALVVARAAADGMTADEVVLLGAPGLGAGGAGFDRDGGGPGLWSASAAADPIALLARVGIIHGEDPSARARPLPTSVDGHGAYLEDPVLLDALARLALGDGAGGTVAAG